MVKETDMYINGPTIQMSLSMRQSLTMALELTTSDSAAHTIFPEVEEWLEDSDRQNAIDKVAKNKDTDKYRSVMDFLCCEVNTELRRQCFKFYLSGDQKDRFGCIFDGPTRDRYAARILIALEVAHQAFCNGRRMSWSKMLATVQIVEEAA